MRHTHSRTWLFSGAAGGALALAAALAPQAWADDAQDLGTLVISANRTETPLDQVGSTVTVITAEDIEKKQAATALDVLEEVPGFTNYGYGGRGTGGSFYLRGIPAKGVLVLIDGVNAADPSSTQVQADLAHLQADDIERIEVLRGNQSTLYGSSAIGGVISITTKSGKGAGKAITGVAGAEFGTTPSMQAYSNIRGEIGKIYYAAAVSGLSSHGIDSSAGGWTAAANTGEHDGTTTQAVNLRIGSDVVEDIGILDKLNLEALGSYNLSTREYDGSATADGDNKLRSTAKTGKLSATADMFDGLLRNAVSASQSLSRRDYYNPHNTRTNFYDGEITKYEYQGTLKPVEDHTLVFGLDHERQHMVSATTTSSYPAKSVTDDGVFGNYQVSLLDDTLTLTAGARHDDHETFGSNTTWRTTAGYRVPVTGTRLHASYGTGFRAPSLFELYAPTYGDSTLRPEKTRGYDIGAEQSFFGDRLILGTTFFNTRMKDAIIYDSGANQYKNISSMRVFGLENEATLHATDEISVTASHTWMQARDNSSGAVPGANPHHTGSLRVSYAPAEVKGLDAWMKVRGSTWGYSQYRTGNKYTGGYAVWDLGATYAVSEETSVYLRVENLFDKTYNTTDWYGEPGMTGIAGLRVKF
ncbi:MAG: TonB-dependent receptor plug domain-containing protein [Rhodospirillaceae bacterium]